MGITLACYRNMQLACLAVAALICSAPAGAPVPRAFEPAALVPEPIPAASAVDAPDPESESAPRTAAPPVLTRADFESLSVHLAREYMVPLDATRQVVRTAVEVGSELKVDPILLLAVIAVESSFDPDAVSSYGATGLMQVVPRFHEDKLAPYGGEEALRDPRINVRVGAEILIQYIRWSGTMEHGLQRYNGAADDPSLAYARRVRARLERFEHAASRVPRTAPVTVAERRV